jgi:hypothetical protein
MTQFITGAPIWVWPLLALLVFAGLRARQDRSALVVLVYGLPALGFLGVRSTVALSVEGWIWLLFAVCYVFGCWGGYQLQRRWV